MIYTNQNQEFNLTSGQIDLLFRARTVWRDIASWVRAYMVYTFLNSDPELQQAAAIMLRALPLKYGSILSIYFGDKAAEGYTVLLSNYINLLISLINVEKSGDTDEINRYINEINENIEERTNYLSGMNPFWQKNSVYNYLTFFNNMTINEINTFLNKDYIRNTELYNDLLSYADDIGDYIAKGLLKYYTYGSRIPRAQ